MKIVIKLTIKLIVERQIANVKLMMKKRLESIFVDEIKKMIVHIAHALYLLIWN